MDMSLSRLLEGDGQGSLACCSPWGRKESDTTERLNQTESCSVYLFTTDISLLSPFILCPDLLPY